MLQTFTPPNRYRTVGKRWQDSQRSNQPTWMSFDCGSRELHANTWLADKRPCGFSPLFDTAKRPINIELGRIAQPCNKYQPINGETKKSSKTKTTLLVSSKKPFVTAAESI